MGLEIKNRDAAGRLCKYTTNHGVITTPTLLPVINPNKMLLTPQEMRQLFGTQIVITNSYIIFKSDTLREKARTHGVHSLLDFDGPIMTDSGTFQSYVYGDIKLDPLKIVAFQQQIGSDIGTILDVFGTPDQTKAQAAHTIKETIKRAQQSIPLAQQMTLACTVQGSIYPDLRTKCAQQLSKLHPGFFPIGGVVPLMENQDYLNLTKIILASKKGLDPSKPVHLFGAGHPLIFPLAVALGCDFFDSSAYIKYAQDDRLLFPWGTKKLTELHELPCSCPICADTTPYTLLQTPKQQRIKLLATHNLYVSFNEIKRIHQAIKEGALWELVEQRAHCNPYLLDALTILHKKPHKQWLEQFEPTSKTSALFYTGEHTQHRPLIHRYQQRLLTNYQLPQSQTIILPETIKPYTSQYVPLLTRLKTKELPNIIIQSPLGPVPIELDEMYPIAQSIFPKFLDKKPQTKNQQLLKKLLRKTDILPKKSLTSSKTSVFSTQEIITTIDHRRLHAVANMQFGMHAADALFNGEITLKKSKKTGKIRTIHLDKQHILSMRAADGLFTLKIPGARKLHSYFEQPRLRVVVNDEAVPFVRGGKSVFAQFILSCDTALRPGDECLLVDKKDTLIGVGRMLLNAIEIEFFQNGMAIKTREGIK